MSAEPTHEKFHGIHARRGNNVHERQVRDRDPKRLSRNLEHEIFIRSYCPFKPPFSDKTPAYVEYLLASNPPKTTTDAGDSITI